MTHRLSRSLIHFATAALFMATSAGAAVGSPPQNPFLADSSFPLPHGDSAQSTSAPQPGPTGPTKILTLGTGEITYTASGPFQFGSFTSSPYPNGRRVMWSSGADRIVKWDHDTLDVIAQYKLQGKPYRNAGDGEVAIRRLNFLPLPLKFIYMLTDLVPLLTDLSGIYSMIDLNNEFYVAGQIADDGTQGVTVYGDIEVGNPDSLIEIKRQWALPAITTGPLVGMNMTFDGRIVLVTEHGWVLTVERDFSNYSVGRMTFGVDEDPTACDGAGFCWVRNSFAVDELGGIYIASKDHMHKVVWTGSVVSTDPADGAWRARYSNDRGFGTGSTPSLMGFGNDPDKFVVITDGDALMNVTLFWRDEIPDGWAPPAGAPSNRIAGMLPADMGPLELTEVQTEQSVLISGYRALVVNNEPRNVPDALGSIDPRLNALIVGFLGNEPLLQPFGLQQFEWKKGNDTFKEKWVNTDVSSLNGVPIVSRDSNLLYTVGARNGVYTLEALDWKTGGEAFHWFLGGSRFNSLYSGILLNENGDIHFNTLWGKVLLQPSSESTLDLESLVGQLDQLLGDEAGGLFQQLGGIDLQNPAELQGLLAQLAELDLQNPGDLQNLLGQLSGFSISNLQDLLDQLELKLPE
jgi:hypothetical protein